MIIIINADLHYIQVEKLKKKLQKNLQNRGNVIFHLSNATKCAKQLIQLANFIPSTLCSGHRNIELLPVPIITTLLCWQEM